MQKGLNVDLALFETFYFLMEKSSILNQLFQVFIIL